MSLVHVKSNLAESGLEANLPTCPIRVQIVRFAQWLLERSTALASAQPSEAERESWA